MKKIILTAIIATVSTASMAYIPNVDTSQQSQFASDAIVGKFEEIIALTNEMLPEERQFYAGQIYELAQALRERGDQMHEESAAIQLARQKVSMAKYAEEISKPYEPPMPPDNIDVQKMRADCYRIYASFRDAKLEFPRMERMKVCKYITDEQLEAWDVQDGRVADPNDTEDVTPEDMDNLTYEEAMQVTE